MHARAIVQFAAVPELLHANVFIRSYVLKFSLEFSVSTVCTEFHITFHMVYYVLCSD